MSCLADAETPHQVEDINYIMTNLASLLAFEWGAAGPQFWLKRCYAAGLADEARSQEMWAASRCRKRQRNGFSPKSSRRNAACWHLDFRTLGLQDCKMIWVTFSCYKFMINLLQKQQETNTEHLKTSLSILIYVPLQGWSGGRVGSRIRNPGSLLIQQLTSSETTSKSKASGML